MEPSLRIFRSGLSATLVLLAACAAGRPGAPTVDQTMPRPALRRPVPAPRRYLAARRQGAIAIDGRLDEEAWRQAPWTAAFTDIEGSIRAKPRFRTRVRMLYDDSCWYIAAELAEPDLWATITQRDAVIFHDNDFELFVDPDGDTHRYAELEMNALGTAWDLLLDRPYRDGGTPDNSWNIAGLRIAVALDGTLNHPGDRDRGWTVEIAIPWAAMTATGWNGGPPSPGSQWRVNFSRVEWETRAERGAYLKVTDPATGKPLPEHNWVWSPQGAINMHIPEMWGVVQFGGSRMVTHPADDEARWALRRVYYAERSYHAAHGRYADSLATLGLPELRGRVTLQAEARGWSAIEAASGWTITADGRLQQTSPPSH